MLLVPFWHKPDCRLRTDGSSISEPVTTSDQIVLLDKKEIQDAQLIANSPRTARGKEALQLGGSISPIEEPWRRMLQHGRGSECSFPTSSLSHESLQAERRARGREILRYSPTLAGQDSN